MANELRITTDTCIEKYRFLKCKQHDSRPLIITLLSNGEVYIPSGTLTLRGRRSDGQVVSQTSNITVANNIITVNPVQADIVAIAGEVLLELNINSVVTTDTFILDVKPSVGAI